MRDSIKFEIVKHIGTLSTSKSGWSAELNLVSWNGAEPKYDIRDWSADHSKMGKGVTLDTDEALALYRALKSVIKEEPKQPEEDEQDEPKDEQDEPKDEQDEPKDEPEEGPEEDEQDEPKEEEPGVPEPDPNPQPKDKDDEKPAFFFGKELNDRRQEFFLVTAVYDEVLGYVPTEEYLQVVFKKDGGICTYRVYGNSAKTFRIEQVR